MKIRTSSSAATTMRDTSRLQVLNVIRANPSMSRSELASRVNISRATVSVVVNELLASGLVEEEGAGESTGGRPPIKLRYCPEKRLAIGVIVFDNTVEAVLTDLEGHAIDSYEGPAHVDSLESMLVSVVDVVQDFLNRTAVSDPLLGVGVGIPGTVDIRTGVFEQGIGPGWLERGLNVKEFLETGLNLPVYAVNRSRVAAIGECRVGVGRGTSNLVYVYIGQGIASGIILDGSLFLGTSSLAGEVGHVSVEADGPLCACGNRGCLETYAAESVIVAQARAVARGNPAGALQQLVDGQLERLTFDHVVAAAKQGDPQAISVLHDAGDRIGFAVAHLINLFNPEMVVIGGPVGCKAGGLLLGPIVSEAQRRSLPRALKVTRIVNGTLGTGAAAIGAALFAIDHTSVDEVFSGDN